MKVGITGHRNQRLGLPEDETDEKWTPIQLWIIDELSKFIKTCADNNELLDLYTGMASGSDIAFAIAGVSMHYINSIKLHCILPCKDYNSSHKYYKFLKLKATEWVELSDKFYKGCDNVRDQYIVDKCDVLLAIWDGNKSGGVWSTICKAQKAGKRIVYCPTELFEFHN